MQTAVESYIQLNNAFLDKLQTTIYNSIHEGIVQGNVDANWMQQAHNSGGTTIDIGFGSVPFVFMILGLILAGLLLGIVLYLSTLIDVLKERNTFAEQYASEAHASRTSLGDKLKAVINKQTAACEGYWRQAFIRDDRYNIVRKELETVTKRAFELADEKHAEQTRADVLAHKNAELERALYDVHKSQREHYDARYVPTTDTYNNPRDVKMDSGYQPIAEQAPE